MRRNVRYLFNLELFYDDIMYIGVDVVLCVNFIVFVYVVKNEFNDWFLLSGCVK